MPFGTRTLTYTLRFSLLLALFAAVAFSASSPAARGQETPTGSSLRLQSTTFDPLLDAPLLDAPLLDAPLLDNPVTAAQASPDAPYRLVQFTGPVDATTVAQIEALGGDVFGYVPDNAHIVRLDAANVAAVQSLPGVRWVGDYQPAYKIAPGLTQSVSAAGSEPIELSVLAFPGESPDAMMDFLRAQGATLLSSGTPGIGMIFRISAPPSAVAAIAQHPGINWVERYEAPTLDNAEGRKIMGGEVVWRNYGYFGEGQIVAISDSGLSTEGQLSADFDGRLVAAFAPSEMNLAFPECSRKTDWTDLNGHGTHVAGSVLGNGSFSGGNAAAHDYTSSFAGLAPEAGLVFMALNTDGSGGIQCVDENGDFLAKGYQAGARISSHSWGRDDGGAYSINSSLVDDYLWRHKDYLTLYAGGNSGPEPQTVGSPGTAKNVLTVGASENLHPDIDAEISDDPDTMAYFSSRGPTSDGRIKPDVVAPGTSVLSTRAEQVPLDGFPEGVFDDHYAYMSGTSMATPLTAGASALVREWLIKGRNIANPSAALLKAVLINGALQLPGQAVPSLNSGHGRVDLKNTLGGEYALLVDYAEGLDTGEQQTYVIDVLGEAAVGTLFATSVEPTVQAASQPVTETFGLTSVDPPAASVTLTNPAALTGEALPGFASARPLDPVESGTVKADVAPLGNAAPSLIKPAPSGEADARFQPLPGGFEAPRTQSFLQNVVGGGDFEDPAWTETWSQVWLGVGLPLRTDLVSASGQYSMWLGGSPSEDALFYPIQFPTAIDSEFESGLGFVLKIVDQDISFDEFCIGLIDASGNWLIDSPECAAANGDYDYDHVFTSAEKRELAGQTAYLALFTTSDGVEPHMSAFIDDVYVAVDFPDVTLTSTPDTGPPGSTFLLTGQFNVPYSPVFFCAAPCSDETLITAAYADAAGNVAAYIYSTDEIEPGTYPIESLDAGGRTARTNVTITGGVRARLSASPISGPGGTEFVFTGSGFVPNDSNIAASINGEGIGSVGSNTEGAVRFSLATNSNATPGDYTLRVTDSAGRSAQTTFTITAVAAGEPIVTVSPAVGPAGSTFAFDAQNFAPSQPVDVALDGEVLGQLETNASGAVGIELTTGAGAPPGVYTLTVAQGGVSASAQFEVTAGDGGGAGGGEAGEPASGRGLYVTLVWTDPPAQVTAGPSLVNDLDLLIDGPDGDIYPGGGTSANRVDNVETVRLENPTPGKYTVQVIASRVNPTYGSQPFALAATTRQTFEANTTNVDVGGGSPVPRPAPQPDPVGTLSGVVYVDANQNGRRDRGEPALADAEVAVLSASGQVAARTTTDADGAYTIADLPLGNYNLQITTTSGHTITSVARVTGLAAGEETVQNIGTIVRVLLPVVAK